MADPQYRGRIAPSPTGYLHLGHASTFTIAHNRAKEKNEILILRIEDLDSSRCRNLYKEAIIEDLTTIGISWHEGPINQSDRLHLYQEIWNTLKNNQQIYPCSYSRKDIQSHTQVQSAQAQFAQVQAASQDEEEESLFPIILRPKESDFKHHSTPDNVNWRFKVPDGRKIQFVDGHYGSQEFEAGKDFGDFLIWRREGIPSYEFAVVVDDYLMGITEVVRGADLLKSTARQILIYEALGWKIPKFYHCDLLYDDDGKPLSKRNRSESLRDIRDRQDPL